MISVKSIETQTPVHFYYDKKQTDSLFVTISVSSKPLTEVLHQLFQGSGFDFSFYNKLILISKGRSIYTQLPIGFFNKENSPAASQLIDYTDYLQKEKSKKAEEMVFPIGTFTRNLSGEANSFGICQRYKLR
ncbi:MAG: STN domain-containing protein [Cyclobacteriaceae bacterium]